MHHDTMCGKWKWMGKRMTDIMRISFGSRACMGIEFQGMSMGIVIVTVTVTVLYLTFFIFR